MAAIRTASARLPAPSLEVAFEIRSCIVPGEEVEGLGDLPDGGSARGRHQHVALAPGERAVPERHRGLVSRSQVSRSAARGGDDFWHDRQSVLRENRLAQGGKHE